VDKEKSPELRHTVLTQVAFHDIGSMGVDAFVADWQLPKQLRLADYDLGRDERAMQFQPVASALGPQLLEWQTAQSVQESWEECERHADLLERIVPPPSDEEEDNESLAEAKGQIGLDLAE
jgi:hypothetical protein